MGVEEGVERSELPLHSGAPGFAGAPDKNQEAISALAEIAVKLYYDPIQ